MPWLGPDSKTGQRQYECGPCRDENHPRYIDPVTKAEMHCGWMSPDEWIGRYSLPQIGNYNGPVCPGYLAQMQCCREAEMACSAYRQGQIKEYFPDQQAPVLLAALRLHGAFNRYEQEQLNKPR